MDCWMLLHSTEVHTRGCTGLEQELGDVVEDEQVVELGEVVVLGQAQGRNRMERMWLGIVASWVVP